MRINYGQSTNISGMAGAVSLCGSGAEFWAVEGGNWKIAEGLIRNSNASLTLNDEVSSIVAADAGGYELGTVSGRSSFCDAVVLAAPLDENNIEFKPPILVPERHSQHTHATFVRGLINPVSS
jgi:prenylcysteine oxidase/farnesylcysteine lyase